MLLLRARVTGITAPGTRREPGGGTALGRTCFITHTSQPDQHHLWDTWHPRATRKEPSSWGQVRKGAGELPEQHVSLQHLQSGLGVLGGKRGAAPGRRAKAGGCRGRPANLEPAGQQEPRPKGVTESPTVCWQPILAHLT